MMDSLEELIERQESQSEGYRKAMHKNGGYMWKFVKCIVFALGYEIISTSKAQSEALDAEFKRLHKRLDEMEGK